MKQMLSGLIVMAVCATAAVAQDQKAATPATAPAEKPAATAPATALTAEAQVCTGITDKMPTGAGISFAANVGMLYCWSKISGARGEAAVKHVWLREGKEMLSVDLPVKSIAWRTNSHKTILPQWTGNWEVKVVDASGATLTSVTFTVGEVKK